MNIKEIFKFIIENISFNDKKFYHGTSTSFKLKPGDFIIPPNISGKISEQGRKKNLDKIFLTTSVKSANIYAHRAKNRFGGSAIIYEVEPEDNVEVMSDAQGTDILTCSKAKIKKIIMVNTK